MSSASDEDDTAYPKMIMEAISALGAADRSAISNHIDYNNRYLPRDHAALVALHLFRLRDSGELLFVDEKYSKPGGSQSQAPAKRGRGRPPKRKSDVSTGAELPSLRPRGRPPKAKDPLATAAAGFPRARGRPPKAEKAAVSTPSSAVVIGVKRGRGRPPKAKPALVAEAV